jgi:hypothetical protein
VDVKGTTGTIHLGEDSVIVRRKGKLRWRTAESAIEKRIPFDQVRGVRIRHAGQLRRGSIEFIVDGWARGDNAILFAYRQQPAFEELSRAVTQRLAGGTT